MAIFNSYVSLPEGTNMGGSINVGTSKILKMDDYFMGTSENKMDDYSGYLYDLGNLQKKKYVGTIIFSAGFVQKCGIHSKSTAILMWNMMSKCWISTDFKEPYFG